MRRFLLTAGFLLATALPAWAGAEDAIQAFKRGDHALALSELRPLADQGDAQAQYFLGHMRAEGLGARQDYAEAAYWFRAAADQGYSYGQFALGYLFERGLGVPKDYGRALGWYRSAADQGLAIAHNNIGVMYEYGRGVPRDYARAYLWYSRSASLPNRDPSKATENLRSIAEKMTPAQIVEGQDLVLDWWHGDPDKR